MSNIDTSKMSAGQREALELTEAARGNDEDRSFAGGLFMGRCAWDQVYPFPEQSPADIEAGQPFLTELARILRDEVDADQIDADGEIPEPVIQHLAAIGAFGIKIPKHLGGLGLSQTNYCHAARLLGATDANLTALLSAHQSIGVPQPLKLFGTEEQQRKFLPRVAKGEISAFALTETDVGSDPARMKTTAEPEADGRHYVINGEKLWCTNGTKAGVIIVMARTPDEVVNGKPRRRITAFIVEMNTPGVEVVTRCRFMGLRALYNGVVRFTNVRVPAANIVGGVGRGLKVALTTLNTGRLTIPAACVGLMQKCLDHALDWAETREQWGAPIGKHAAIGEKLAQLAADIFATESMVLLTAALVDRDPHADIRLEAAMCKLYGSEAGWRAVDDTLQIRGGRGYETAASQRARGETPVPVERYLRDSRINRIFEGSTEIMHLFLAREALDPHLKVAGAVLDTRLPLGKRAAAAMKAGGFYALWYPSVWLPANGTPAGLTPELAPVLAYARRASRRLARTLFHAMALHGPALEKRQLTLGRIVDIGTELFALTASTLRADALIKGLCPNHPREELLRLVVCLHRRARLRIDALHRDLATNTDDAHHALSRELLDGRHTYLRPKDPGLSRPPFPTAKA